MKLLAALLAVLGAAAAYVLARASGSESQRRRQWDRWSRE